MAAALVMVTVMLLQQVLIEVMRPFSTHHCIAVKCRERYYGDSMRARPLEHMAPLLSFV